MKDFKRQTEQFYSAPDGDEENRWVEAFKAMREGLVKVEAEISALPKETPENRPAFIAVMQVLEMSRCTTADNVPDKLEVATAA